MARAQSSHAAEAELRRQGRSQAGAWDRGNPQPAVRPRARVEGKDLVVACLRASLSTRSEMKKLYPICIATVLSPLGFLVLLYVWGSAKNLYLLNFFLPYALCQLLLCLAAIVAVLAVGIRHVWFSRSSKKEQAIGCTALAFLIVLPITSVFGTQAFVCGARARIDSLGGPAFVTELLGEAELLARDADPSWKGEIPEDRIPAIFRIIGCKNVGIRTELGFVHLGVSGAFFPSGWWLIQDDTDFQPPSYCHKVYSHLYRFAQ